jgi:hypothetical protein
VLSVLLISACAVLAGARSYAAIAEYAHDSRRNVLDALQIGPVAPHASTIRRVLQQLDPDAMDAALRSWTLARLAAQAPNPPPWRPSRESRKVLAVDGKTVRGARRPDGSRAHLVALFDLTSGAVLAQREIASKGGEVAVVPRLLDGLDLTDVLVTADALHTQRGHADYLHSRGGHYLMTVKANQPRLLHRLRAASCPGAGSGRPHGCGPAATAGSRPAPLASCPCDRFPTSTRTAPPSAPPPARRSWPLLRNLALTALRLAGSSNIAAGLRHHAREHRRPLATYAIT